MHIVVVPGFHSSSLTHAFLQSMHPLLDKAWVVDSNRVPTYSPHHVLTLLHAEWEQLEAGRSNARDHCQTVLFIGFSAGVVGSIGAARQWQAQGRQVRALIAFDGWGVPLYGNFPIHRVSHDSWTHWSSGGWGDTQASFYADPPVNHLDLWRSPHMASGIRTDAKQFPSSFDSSSLKHDSQPSETAASFVRSLLEYYQKQP